MLAAHDPGDIMHASIIRNHGHAGAKRVGLAVERQHFLAISRAPRHHRAGQLGQVIDMRRATERQHHVVGDVDQRADRLLPRRNQPLLHPFGRSAVRNTAHNAAIECRAALRIVGTNFHGAGVSPGDLVIAQRLERAQTSSRQIARHAVYAHAIGPVRRNRHVQHRAGAVVFGKGCADRRIGGQFDDPLVIFAQFQFARGAHHAVGFDAANGVLAQHHAVCGHHRARNAQHALHPCTRIRRAAHDLQRLACTHVDGKHLQLVRIGMRPGGEHFGHTEPGQLFRRVFDAFNFDADRVQLGRDFSQRCLGIEEVAQPFERELHAFAPTPAERVGWSNAEKP